MALTTLNKLAMQRWIGEVDDADHDDYDALIGELGSPEVAALQVLLTRRAEMRLSPADRSIGDDRFGHGQNFDQLDSAVDELVGFLSTSADVSLSLVGQALVDQARGTVLDTSDDIVLTVRNPRRG